MCFFLAFRGADDLYVCVVQSGKEDLIHLREGSCECRDFQYLEREGGCKYIRKCRIVKSDHPVTSDALLEVDSDPQLGAHVDADGPHAVATDGGRMEWADTPDYSEHVESAEQGSERFHRCSGCGRELLVAEQLTEARRRVLVSRVFRTLVRSHY